MRQFRTEGLGRLILSGWLLAAGFALWLGPALPGQDFSGANQSDDPCYKIKQMKKAILKSADYKKTVGNKDPSYIQCTPLTVNLTWKLTDSIVHSYGKDTIDFELQEEYPAYLMLHYGWFDKLQRKELQRFEIMGPEPCWAPCPGRAKAELSLEGQAVICMDYYQNCKPSVVSLTDLSYEVSPSDEENQNAFLWIKGEEGNTSGSISSSQMRAKPGAKPKGRGVVAATGHFWNNGQYRIELNGSGINTNELHRLSMKSDWTFEEIFDGLRTGVLTKVLQIHVTEPGLLPQAPVYSLQGTVTVKIAFGPVKEERWRVMVKGQEKDNRKGDFVYKDQKGQAGKIPVCAYFDLNLVGEFVIRKVKDDWSYKEGRVTKAESVISFTQIPPDLYHCTFKECAELQGIPSMVGNVLQGTLQAKKIKLAWAEVTTPRTSVCVFCKPKKSFLSKIPYKQEFGSSELVYNLNKEVLPLQNGWTASRKVGDFLTYTITLTKIQ
jgi:hypothetical protein